MVLNVYGYDKIFCSGMMRTARMTTRLSSGLLILTLWLWGLSWKLARCSIPIFDTTTVPTVTGEYEDIASRKTFEAKTFR